MAFGKRNTSDDTLFLSFYNKKKAYHPGVSPGTNVQNGYSSFDPL
jgi:hypothetical protein